MIERADLEQPSGGKVPHSRENCHPRNTSHEDRSREKSPYGRR